MAAGAETFRLEVRRRVARPPMEVFKAWTDPERIAVWFSPGNKTIKATIEPRAGGVFRVELIHEGKPWKLDGEIIEVVPGKLLRFTWVTTEIPREASSLVAVTFDPAEGGATDVHLVHEGFPTPKLRDDHDATGWQQILELIAIAENLSAEALRAAIARLSRAGVSG